MLVFRGTSTTKDTLTTTQHISTKDPTHTSHQHNTMENDMMKEDVILPTVSYSLSAIVRTKKEGNNTTKLEYALVHDKVDAAARKRAEEKAAHEGQQYTLVHEKSPRGWWLPGGGVEHRDITPVDGAIREALEEAGSPSLSHMLPLFTTTQTNDENINEDELKLLPTMTHLLSLEQSPGRQRFIFRGEWIDDDNNDSADDSNTHNCDILKCPPGDDESEEAQWVTLDEVQQIANRQRGDTTQVESDSTFLQQMKDPWLRGHEPVTFFGLLEYAWQQNEVVPGLPVYKMNLSGNDIEVEEEEVTGAFFGRHTLDEESQLVHHGSRSALLTHLKCSLLVYDKSQQAFAIDKATNIFPSSLVSDQNEMSLKKLVDDMISDYVPSHPSADNASVGLLRVQHIIHENGREATLTVYPYILFPDTSEISNKATDWVPIDELSSPLEKRLAEVVMDDNQMKEKYSSLEVLRDKESPRRCCPPN